MADCYREPVPLADASGVSGASPVLRRWFRGCFTAALCCCVRPLAGCRCSDSASYRWPSVPPPLLRLPLPPPLPLLPAVPPPRWWPARQPLSSAPPPGKKTKPPVLSIPGRTYPVEEYYLDFVMQTTHYTPKGMAAEDTAEDQAAYVGAAAASCRGRGSVGWVPVMHHHPRRAAARRALKETPESRTGVHTPQHIPPDAAASQAQRTAAPRVRRAQGLYTAFGPCEPFVSDGGAHTNAHAQCPE